ncbi:hypothetical protein GGTG_10046 [Gaeumannomyces tritici R3-111a-1]|uniref:Uncharacterized protein n=1 Tax=Gaeumannomyces tritici (strain R3-111a-1) TaxID=644352 RepID=J3P961_GAET3|nr:hypothetical protein GGTG_10046 [Gaeumannomyces tritici R3-111a-1]EJT73197.1 hypothetical protein GGTG_10046 [Gaeumannomyces tritici R3-111a-1]
MLQKQHNERKLTKTFGNYVLFASATVIAAKIVSAIIVAAKIVSAEGGTSRRQYKRCTFTGNRAALKLKPAFSFKRR